MGFGNILNNIKNMRHASKLRNLGSEALLEFDDEDLYEVIDEIVDDAVLEIDDPRLPEEIRIVYSLISFEREVNNGGVCQFFVNSSSECAPYMTEAFDAVGDEMMKKLWVDFLDETRIDVNDVSSFKVDSYEEYEKVAERYDFDAFDDAFYDHSEFHELIIAYFRKNIDALLID